MHCIRKQPGQSWLVKKGRAQKGPSRLRDYVSQHFTKNVNSAGLPEFFYKSRTQLRGLRGVYTQQNRVPVRKRQTLNPRASNPSLAQERKSGLKVLKVPAARALKSAQILPPPLFTKVPTKAPNCA